MVIYLNFGYIDPTAGASIFSNGPFIIGLILGLFGFLLTQLKLILNFFKKFFRFFLKTPFKKIIFVFFVVLLLAGVMVMLLEKKETAKKVVILGIDALDPNIMQTLMSEGRLPNFNRLKETGTFSLLKTTNPAQSPVAWVSFATGCNPGKFNLFDFLVRDPQTYLPEIAITNITKPKTCKIGRFAFQVSQPEVVSRIKGRFFWDYTSQYNIPSSILFCPSTFPPKRLYGKLHCGLGTPDIRGTQGTFSFYTTAPAVEKKDTGGIIFYVKKQDNKIKTKIAGPLYNTQDDLKEAELPLEIKINSDNDSILLCVQDEEISLKPQQMSGWVRFKFRAGNLKSIYAIGRFYLKAISPQVELYLSALNIDPVYPVFPVSSPPDYSKQLAEEIGLYHTLGMPHDTWALNEKRIDESIFLKQFDLIFKEREKILFNELDKFKEGIFFYYFEEVDILQHMFYRYTDAGHPLYEKEAPEVYKNVIPACYQKMDCLLGRVMSRIDDDVLLIILSDHGFGSFKKAVHLNAWLRENNLLNLRDPAAEEGRELFRDVDWTKTKAYALGFSGIYLNEKGREKEGVVFSDKEKKDIKKETKEKLLSWIDPQTGEAVIKNVYFKEDIYSGGYVDNAPDIIIGYNINYRASWQTAIGAVPAVVLEKNEKKWSGDHIFDPDLVPGVLFVNRKIKTTAPEITDIAPTILKYYGIEAWKQLDGRPFL